MKKKKIKIKPFGWCVIVALALSVAAGIAFGVRSIDKSSEAENTLTEEMKHEIEQPKEIRTYYAVHDDGVVAVLDEEYQSYVYDMCDKYGIAGYEQLVVAMLYEESSFDPKAISASNDYGMAQINIGNHDWLRETLGVTDFLDPYQSIECGVFMLANALETNNGSISKALVAYNKGQGTVNSGVTENFHSRKVIETIGNMTEHSVEFIF